MSKNSNFGGSSNMRTQIQNLWQAINSIETGGGGGGTGNMNYIGGSTTVGQHYKTTSTNGLNCDKSSINETNTDFTFGNKNLGTTGDITSNAFIKNGGTNQQYLMADGSTLEASANSGNSNIYLYNSISNVMTPPIDIGDIGYNNINQSNATIIYISHLTRDGLDIERYYNDLTDLNYVYIQDQSNSTNFIKYIITGTPTIIINEYISIPVAVEDSGGTGATTFGNNHDIMLSFFSNLIEIDQRITSLESKTENQFGILGTTVFNGDLFSTKFKVNGQTGFLKADGNIDNNTYLTPYNASLTYLPLIGGTMSGNINLNNNQLTNISKIITTSGTFNAGNNNVDNYNSTPFNVVCGNNNVINNNEQIIFGRNNSITSTSNQTLVVGAGNTNINTGLGNVIGFGNSVIATIGNVMGYNNVVGNTVAGYFTQCIGANNVCNGVYASAIGTDITNNTPHSLCLGNSAITTIYPNSLVCNLGNATTPFKDIYYSGKLINASSLPELTSEYKPNIWYYITTTSTFIGGVFTASTQITAIGGTLTQIATSNTNWRTRKSGRINCPTVSVADGQRSGFIGTATFPAIYSGSGWFFSFDFSITDTNVATSACTRMFVGFGITTVAPSLATGTAISALQNMIGIGHDNGDTVLSFYSRGPAVGTANGNKIATTFSCATPSTKIFTATFYSPTNSDDIMIKLYDQETRTSAYQTFTLGGTLTPISTSPLIPVWVRAMAPVSGGSITNSAQLGLNGFKWHTL